MEQVLTTVLDERRCHLGEGCTYDRASGTAWWFDILETTLFEAKIASGAVKSHALPRMGSVLAYVDDRRQVIAADDGLYIRDIASNRLDLHTPLEADNPSTRSNDGRTHACGAMWIGTMGRNAEQGAGAIYHFHLGRLTQLYTGVTVPNAICFSPDGVTAYFTDTRKAILNRVAIDPLTALPVGEPATLYDHRGGLGGLDGAVVDADGRIWNARWGGSCVDVYTPAGDRIRTIAVPATRPTCPVFIGPNLDRMLVTTACQNMDPAARAADPGHGQTFILDVGARGRPEPRIKLSAV